MVLVFSFKLYSPLSESEKMQTPLVLDFSMNDPTSIELVSDFSSQFIFESKFSPYTSMVICSEVKYTI